MEELTNDGIYRRIVIDYKCYLYFINNIETDKMYCLSIINKDKAGVKKIDV